jgi:tetratricopeptide (TPR) repeat protein
MADSPGTPAPEEPFRVLRECTAAIRSGAADAQTYLRRGIAHQRLRSLQAAVEDYTMAIAFEPPPEAAHLAQAYDRRNQCYRQLGRYAAAIADGETAVRLAPENARYRMNLGLGRYWAADYAGALADLERAITLDPREWWAYAYRGKVHLALGNAHQAVADFSLAIDELAEDKPVLYGWRAEAYCVLGAYTAAERDGAAGLARDPYDGRLWMLRGWARYQGRMDLHAALGDFTRSIALNPVAEAYKGRALISHALGDASTAALDLSRFVACHPGGPLAGLQEVAALVQELQTLRAVVPA